MHPDGLSAQAQSSSTKQCLLILMEGTRGRNPAKKTLGHIQTTTGTAVVELRIFRRPERVGRYIRSSILSFRYFIDIPFVLI